MLPQKNAKEDPIMDLKKMKNIQYSVKDVTANKHGILERELALVFDYQNERLQGKAEFTSKDYTLSLIKPVNMSLGHRHIIYMAPIFYAVADEPFDLACPSYSRKELTENQESGSLIQQYHRIQEEKASINDYRRRMRQTANKSPDGRAQWFESHSKQYSSEADKLHRKYKLSKNDFRENLECWFKSHFEKIYPLSSSEENIDTEESRKLKTLHDAGMNFLSLENEIIRVVGEYE